MDEMRPVRPWAKKGRRCMATWQLRPENFWPLNLAKGRSFFGTAWSCWVLFRNRPAACEKSATRQSEYAKMWRSCWSHWVEDVSNVLYVSVYLCAFTNPILLRYITGWWCQRYMVTYASTYNCLYTLGCVTQPDQHHDVQATSAGSQAVLAPPFPAGCSVHVAGFIMLMVMLGMAAKKLSSVQNPCW